MAYGSHTENLPPRTFCILVSKMTRSCSVNIYYFSYLSDFIYKIKCSKQKLTSFVTSITCEFPCWICAKNVLDKDEAVQCDICEFWIHIKCNNFNYLDYRYLQNCHES